MFCGNMSPVLKTHIKDNTKTLEYCPYCLNVHVLTNKLNLEPCMDFIDDITNKPGAIQYIAHNESYTLNVETLKRLITHTLTKKEYKILHDKYGDCYMLHEDFYDKNGNYI